MSSITVQAAVSSAKQSLLDLYADDPPKALALEGVEFVTEGKRPLWSITLGFHRPKPVLRGSVLEPSSSFLYRPEIENRIYKTVFIDANTGAFVKMDIRQVQ